MRFYWQTGADGTHYTILDDMRADYKQKEPGLFSWWITWEGYILVKGHAQTAKEAMAFVANWHSAYRSSIVGEALVVLMSEVKRLQATLDHQEKPELNLKAGADIRAGEAVYLDTQGQARPMPLPNEAEIRRQAQEAGLDPDEAVYWMRRLGDIRLLGPVIAQNKDKPERIDMEFSGLALPETDGILPAGDYRVGTALEHRQLDIDVPEDKETPDANDQ